MKTLHLLLLLIGISTAHAQYNTDNLKVDENLVSMTLYAYENLKLYPVRANETFHNHFKDLGQYKSLQEAMDNEALKITEISESGTVNTLYATNESNDSIYLMAGQVIKGGKQDRTLAQDVILAPGEKINVAAFCVEKGRWAGDEESAVMLEELAVEDPVNLNAPAYRGSSKTYAFDIAPSANTMANQSVRKAITKDKNQRAVWDEVGDVTAKNNADTETGTFNALENSESFQKNRNGYIKKLGKLFDNDPSVIGVVAISGDKVIGCDLFATHEMFNKAYDDLLNAYVTEAITNGEKVSIGLDEVRNYLNDFLADESKQREKLAGKDGDIFEMNDRKLHIWSY